MLRNFVHSQDPNQGGKQAVCKVGESLLKPLSRFCNKIKTHIYIYGTFAVILACPLVERPLSLWQKSSQLMKTWWQVFKRIFSMEKNTHTLTCLLWFYHRRWKFKNLMEKMKMRANKTGHKASIPATT